MPNLTTIVNRIKQGGENEKTAAPIPKKEVVTKDALETAVNETADKLANTEKTAGSNDAVSELMKIAESLTGAEKQAELEEAKLLGAAFADGALSKIALFEAQVAEKTAAQTTQYRPQDFDSDALLKMAAEIGYQDTTGRLIKVAMEEEEAEKDKKELPPFIKKKKDEKKDEDKKDKKKDEKDTYEEGYKEAALQIENATKLEFLKGAAVAEYLVDRAKEQNATRTV